MQLLNNYDTYAKIYHSNTKQFAKEVEVSFKTSLVNTTRST